jgi:hypothetical protein
MGFLNKIFKPVSRVLDKVIPNEIKPALPFAAAAFPFLAPELFASMGGLGGLITNPIAQRAVAGGITNLVSQASQEGAERRGINPMSFGIGTLGGALTAPSSEFGALKSIGTDAYGIGDAVRFNDIPSLGYADVMGGFDPTNIPLQGPVQLPADVTSNISSLDKIGNSVLGGAQTASDFFNKGVTALDQNGILDPTFLKAYAPGAIGAASDLAYNAAKDAQLKYQDQQAALGQTASANRQNQIDYIRKAMQTAGFTSPEIDDALKRSGFADGGRAGYGMGGDVIKSLKGMKNKLTDYLGKLTDDIKIYPQTDYATDSGASLDLTIIPKTKKGKSTLDKLVDQGYVDKHSDGSYFMSDSNLEEGTILLNDYGVKASGVYEPSTKGKDIFESFRSGAGLSEYASPYYGYDRLRYGLYNSPRRSPMSGAADLDTIPTPPEKFANGGLMSLGGHEMDYRAAGGFVPIGQKERADDVPARLSKNEFVFTAKAVRNAGGGDIKEGAKRMYQIMRQLEAKA